MAELQLKRMREDIKLLRRDIAVIKHILFEQESLNESTRKRLAKARKTPLSEYTKL